MSLADASAPIQPVDNKPAGSPPPVQSNTGGLAAASLPVTNAVPASPKYFSAVDKEGNSFGFSDQKDTSGKNFFAYRAPGDTATTTDYTRVATPFDPRVAAPQTKTSFSNPRAIANRAALKTSMGGSYSDELDHVIALELSGSNNPANLQIEPNVPGTKNTATDPLENSLAKDVAAGKKSLFDAQVELSKAKNAKTPFTGIHKVAVQSIFDKVSHYLSDVFDGEPQPVDSRTPEQVPVENSPEAIKKNETSKANLKFIQKNKSSIGNPTPQTFSQKLGGVIDKILPGEKPENVPNSDQGTLVKVPFINRVIQLPNTGASKILKDIIETPDRIKNTLDGNQKPTNDYFNPKVASYVDIKNQFEDSLIKGGMNSTEANIVSSIYAGAAGILDIATLGSITSQIDKAVIKNVAVPSIEHEFAWRALGSPTTIEEAEKTARTLQKVYHPDIPETGNAKISADINNNLKVLRDQGIPKAPSLPARYARNTARALETDISELKNGLPQEVQAPFVAPAKQLPGYRSANPMVPAGLSTDEVEPVGFGKNTPASLNDASKPIAAKPEVYQGEKDLTVNTLEKLKGRDTVSKTYISDLTNQPDLKQPEREAVRAVLSEYPDGSDVPVKEFADKVKQDLLPLKINLPKDKFGRSAGGGRNMADTAGLGYRYEHVSLPTDVRGSIENYKEHIYESPIKNSTGGVHFEQDQHPGYFAHTRIEDVPGGTRRVIEAQSDLFQKGRLENEHHIGFYKNMEVGSINPEIAKRIPEGDELIKLDKLVGTEGKRNLPEKTVKRWEELSEKAFKTAKETRSKEVSKLEPYRNTWHERIIREEIKQAAKDGKTKLQFPTGETAMKIEGLGQSNRWSFFSKPDSEKLLDLKPSDLKVGMEINEDATTHRWIITDVLGDGKFKAIPKRAYDLFQKQLESNKGNPTMLKLAESYKESNSETFDISGKVDTNNPIYRFYEKEVSRYLKRIAPDMRTVTDKQRVLWYEINVPKEAANKPVTAFKKGAEYKPLGRGPKIEVSKIPDLLKDYVPKENIKYIFNPDLLKEEGALGQFRSRSSLALINDKIKPVIELYEKSGKAYVSTAFHEAYHYLENKVFSSDFVDTLNKETLDKMSPADHRYYSDYKTPEERAAEYRADEFAKEQTSKSGYKSPIQKIIDSIKEAVKKIIDSARSFKDYLNAIPNKKGGFVKLPFEEEPVTDVVKTKKEYRLEEKADDEYTKALNSEPLDRLKEQRAIFQEALSNDPAKPLVKYTNKRTGELPEQLKGGDELASNAGFPDYETARKAVQNYKIQQARFMALTKEVMFRARIIRAANLEAKDEAELNKLAANSAKHIDELLGSEKDRQATIKRISQQAGIGEHKPPTVRGDIQSPVIDFTQAVDKAALSLSRETMERNIEGVFGKQAAKINDFLVEPIRINETNRIKYTNDIREKIKETLVDKLGIKPGSMEDKLVQLYGEKQITPETLKEIVSKNKTIDYTKIKEASDFLRNIYDDILDRVNAGRLQFNYRPIPKRQDYFRHFHEMDGFINQFGFLLNKTELPTAISGLTEHFKPGMPFSNAAMQRLGKDTAVSALKGMDNYINSISRQMFHIDSVQRGRAFEKYLRQEAQLDSHIKLPNFVSNLNDYTNMVAGKQARLDRAVESVVGRRSLTFLTKIRQIFGRNVIAGNISAAITHSIPFNFTLASVDKVSAAKGLAETLRSPLLDDWKSVNGIESKFLVRRFPTEAIEYTPGQKVTHTLAFVFRSVDQFISKFAVSAKFYEGLNKGIAPEEAMKQADNYANRVIGDRSIGNLPNAMNTKTLGLITQFQIEINDNLSFLIKDIPRLYAGKKWKIVSAYIQFAIYSYLWNQAMKKLKGQGKGIDPIEMGLTLAGHDEGQGLTFGGRVKAVGSQLLQEAPFSSAFTGGFPVAQALPTKELLAGDWLGVAKKIGYGFVSPFGGGAQLQKTAEGIYSYTKGEVKSASGKTTTPIERNASNLIKGVLFGKNSFNESIESNNDSASARQAAADQSSASKIVRDKIDELNNIADTKGQDAAQKAFTDLQAQDPALAKKVVTMMKQPVLTPAEASIKLLGVNNGKRAEWIADKAHSIKNKDERDAYLNNLVQKKLITETVYEQLPDDLK